MRGCLLLPAAVALLLSAAPGESTAFDWDRDIGPFEPRYSLRGLMGVGLYSMGDVKDVYDAMQEVSGHGFASTDFEPGATLEWAAQLTVAVDRRWSIGAGLELVSDDFCLCLDDGDWFDANQCDAYFKAGGRLAELCVIRYLAGDPGGVRSYVAVGLGYGWTDVEGDADDIVFSGSDGAPLVRTGVGVDFGTGGVAGANFEVGYRHIVFDDPDISLQAAAGSEMDEVYEEFLEDGSVDFSGFFFRGGLLLSF